MEGDIPLISSKAWVDSVRGVGVPIDAAAKIKALKGANLEPLLVNEIIYNGWADLAQATSRLNLSLGRRSENTMPARTGWLDA